MEAAVGDDLVRVRATVGGRVTGRARDRARGRVGVGVRGRVRARRGPPSAAAAARTPRRAGKQAAAPGEG